MIKIYVVVLFIAFSFGCQSINKDKNGELVNSTSEIESVLTPKGFSYDIFINEDTNDTIYHGLSLNLNNYFISKKNQKYFKFNGIYNSNDVYIRFAKDTIYSIRKSNVPFSERPFLIFKPNLTYVFGFTGFEYNVRTEKNDGSELFEFHFDEIPDNYDNVIIGKDKTMTILKIEWSKRKGLVGMEILDKKTNKPYRIGLYNRD